MVRTVATISLAFIMLAANAILAGARADYPHQQAAPDFCKETAPYAPLRSKGPDAIRNRDGIVGGEGSTGPTFPSVCRQGATMHSIGDELPAEARG